MILQRTDPGDPSCPSFCPSTRVHWPDTDGQDGRGARMAGSMRQRGKDSWQLRVHAGRDPATGRKRYVERTFRGTKREASKALAAMVAEAERRHRRDPPARERSPSSAESGSTTRRRASRPRPSRPPGCTSRTRSSRPRIHPGREAHPGGSRPLLPPPARGRSLTRSLRPGHHPTCPRHHSTGIDPGRPLGLDHAQSGHRRLASPGAA